MKNIVSLSLHPFHNKVLKQNWHTAFHEKEVICNLTVWSSNLICDSAARRWWLPKSHCWNCTVCWQDTYGPWALLWKWQYLCCNVLQEAKNFFQQSIHTSAKNIHGDADTQYFSYQTNNLEINYSRGMQLLIHYLK